MGLHPLWTQILSSNTPATPIISGIYGISGCPWAVAVTLWLWLCSCRAVAVAAISQLLEEFKIVFAEANLLNKQKAKVKNFRAEM